MPDIQPIRPHYHLEVLNPAERQAIKDATLHILEHVGVRFPSDRALEVFATHGARVDREQQIVFLPPDLVTKAMSRAPRTYMLAGRADDTELCLDGTASYFATDGCGVETIDFDTRQRRPSCKDDVARMARVADYLSSIAFYWPMVSAQDYGKIAPLHELDASFNNTVKHVQNETVMGERPARYAIEMATVIAGSAENLRARPPLSVLVCTIAPLGQDRHGIEGAMAFAEAGIPVGFMSMPNMGSTAPAAPGGALAMGSAESVSAMVLMQLVAPGAPVFHSLLASVMHPATAEYITGIPGKHLCNAAAVQLAHDWGVPTLAGAFGQGGTEPATWQLGRDSVYTSLLVPLSGADMVVAAGLIDASTVLLPEQIIYDDEIYHTNRILLEGVDVGPEGLALDVVAAVGPGGHFMAQKHTRQHLREMWIPDLTQPRPAPDGLPLPDIQERARDRVQAILVEHHPDPLPAASQAELQRILAAAAREFNA